MIPSSNKVTSWEISRYMLEQAGPVTASEVTQAMRSRYPHLEANQRAIYLRMRSICQSKCSNGIMNTNTRPMTFELSYIEDAYFLGRISSCRMDAMRRELMHLSKEERERRGTETRQAALRILNDLAKRRQAF